MSHAKPQMDRCQTDEQSIQLMQLVQSHPEQQRPQLNCNALLNQIAQKKLEALAISPEFWHQAGRMSPNQWLRHHGYELSISYPFIGNQVEALAGGEVSAEAAFKAFMNSKVHRTMLLGDDPFFKAQNHIGVAYLKAPESEHVYYWAVLIADTKRKGEEAPYTLTYNPRFERPEVQEKPLSVRERMNQRRVKTVLDVD